MHWRIYLWLSCVVLAGYVRATEPTENSAIPTRDLVPEYQDDDGSGVEDESSGSGWGAGPGVDDEDGRGSGEGAPPGETDDEDFIRTTNFHITVTNRPITTTQETIIIPDVPKNASVPDDDDLEVRVDLNYPEIPIQETTPLIPSDPFEVVIPRVKQPIEGSNADVITGGARDNAPSRPEQTDISISGEDINSETDHETAGSNVESDVRRVDTGVFIMNAKPEDRATTFFSQPHILAAVIGGAVVGLLSAILVVMFIVYRMRKKDEGSYALDEPKRSPAAASYGKGHNNREFYA